jgi:hypothetical protein
MYIWREVVAGLPDYGFDELIYRIGKHLLNKFCWQIFSLTLFQSILNEEVSGNYTIYHG